MKRRSGGFTLIETLFVIAILSVIASMGVALYQTRANTAKTNQATEQVDVLTQAVVEYYNKHGFWPSKLNQSDLSTYIPYGKTNSTGEYLNPWGGAYTSTTTDITDGNYNITTLTPNENSAAQIKAKLPFATSSTQNNQGLLQVGIPVPGNISMSNYIFIRQGTVKLNNVDKSFYNMPKFTCPKDYVGHVSVGIRGLMSANT